MIQAYSDPSREDDPHALPDVEVFYCTKVDAMLSFEVDDGAGWYYWYCFPGCLPDSDPVGPFASESAALMDAREQSC